MYFHHDSWGKFGFNYLNKEDGEIIKINTDAIAEIYWHSPYSLKNEDHYQNILQKVLEGLQVPIYNSQTNEEDFADISLVEKIAIDSSYLMEIVSDKPKEVKFTLKGDEETNIVLLTADLKDTSHSCSSRISLESFEKMLFNVMHNMDDKRLELEPSFKKYMDDLLKELIDENNGHLVLEENKYSKDDGLGIIRDTKTNQDVGTFTSIQFVFERQEPSNIYLENLLLTGRTMKDLEESDRYEFLYFTLDDRLIYSCIPKEDVNYIKPREANLEIEGSTLLVSEFNESHPLHSSVAKAQTAKIELKKLKEDHPLYSDSLSAFNSMRLGVIEESRNKQRQEDLINQFSDIDLGF